jgi:hypothetical protein
MVHAEPYLQAASLRFGRDLRLLEVRRLLRSSAPVTLRVGNVPEPSDAGKCRQAAAACPVAVQKFGRSIAGTCILRPQRSVVL